MTLILSMTSRALHLRHQHLPLEVPPQVGHRHPFLLERRLELRLVLEVVLLLDVVEDAVELLVAERVAQLAAALDQQQLVDGVEDQLAA